MDRFEGWSLGSSIDDGNRHALTEVRVLAPPEAAELDAALRLLWWMTGGSRWNDVTAAWQSYSESRATGDLNRLNQSLFALLRALTRFSLQLSTVPDEYEAFADDLRRTDDSGWLALSEPFDANQYVEPPALVHDESTQPKLGQVKQEFILTPSARHWLGLSDDVRAPLDGTINHLVELAQAHHAALLRAFSEPISAASLITKRYAAEVALGRPVLFRAGAQTESGRSYDIRDLALENIVRLSIALNRAMRIADHDSPDPAPTNEPQAEPESDEERGNANPASTDEAGSIAPPKRSTPNWRATDPAGLFMASTQLGRDTEMRWSDALSATVRDETIASDLDQWRSLLVAEWSHINGVEDAAVLGWPVRSGDILALEPRDPNLARVGYLAALWLLSNSLEPIASPPNRELVIEGDRGTLRAWWASGAFALVDSAAQLLLRTAQDIGSAAPEYGLERTDIGIPVQLQAPSAEIWHAAASRSLRSGLPEAALLYCIYGYDSWVAELSDQHGSNQQAALAELESMLPRVREIVARAVEAPQSAAELVPFALLAVEALGGVVSAGRIAMRIAERSADE